MGAKRLGVFGGTFNPIHLGHLHIARRASRLFGLDQIYFVVAAAPPHKNVQNLVPLPHRYAMVSLATAGSQAFIPSLVELDPPESPFSVHTLEKIERAVAVGTRIYFIAGGDSLAEVSTWHESERLLTSYNFIFVTRPNAGAGEPASLLPAKAMPHVRNLIGMEPRRLRQRILAEEASGASLLFLVDLKALDISASRIRVLASRGEQIRNLVPASVHEYLQKTQLYGER